MQRMNKLLFVSLMAFITLSFCGCRKASTRGTRTNTKETMAEVKQKDSGRRHEKKRDDDITPSAKKLSGSEVFERYGKAVFMIFTSDGTNNYQGSGFFVGKNGLAVSNYHVF